MTDQTNRMRLLWAGFTAILAAGVGFGVRGGILDNWGREFGFTGAELGAIGGAGFSGFCFGIIIGGVICDKIGYGKLVITAFALHVLSAFVTFAAMPEPQMAKETAFAWMFWGMFVFAYANGTLEAVANPLVATLFPEKRTHYLNILHASWPLGLVLGGLISWTLDDQMQWYWKYQLALYLIPTVVYGLMFFGQHMPKSEASAKGLGLGEMFKDIGLLGSLVVCFLVALFLKQISSQWFAADSTAPTVIGYGIGAILLAAVGAITRFSLGHVLLFVLFIAHALVGAVELGTDGWIQNITGNILTSEQGKILFVFTSMIMFALRFCADFIEQKMGLSPVGILLACAILACVGLLLTSMVNSFAMALLALAVYAVGKTFFWPTMLAVASDRFPRTGAIAISMMGGIGMLSAGLIGGPGLGYAKDRFAGEHLARSNQAVYKEYKAENPSRFLFFAPSHGLDGKKLGDVQERLSKVRAELAKAGKRDPLAALAELTPAERAVHEASIAGDRKTLVADASIPACMAVIYLLILIYFKSIGGYKRVEIAPGVAAGGIKGPAEY